MTSPSLPIEQIVDELCAEATARTGLADFGPPEFRAPLTMLAEHLNDGLLSAGGEAAFREELIDALVGRLVREEEWKRNPGWKTRRIEKPIVICGIPRTGTTALHKLLAVDPRFQGLDNWLTSWPKPRPPRAQWEQEQGYQRAVAKLEAMFAAVPELRVSHEIVADEVDECLEVLRLDFIANRYTSMFIIPEYDAWFQQQDETPLYRRLLDTIKLIGLNDDRTWLLKNPGHFGHLQELLTVMPDARVIITHRDPVKTLPSLGSVLAGARPIFYTDPRYDQIGPRELAYWTRAKQRTDAIRPTLPEGQILDIDHRAFHSDPIGTVEQIYDHFGITLEPEVRAAMSAWLAANPAEKHGAHTYTLEQYGLTAEAIRAELGEG